MVSLGPFVDGANEVLPSSSTVKTAKLSFKNKLNELLPLNSVALDVGSLSDLNTILEEFEIEMFDTAEVWYAGE